MFKNNPLFFLKFLFFSTYIFFVLQLLCSAENTIKIVFSEKHSFSITQLVSLSLASLSLSSLSLSLSLYLSLLSLSLSISLLSLSLSLFSPRSDFIATRVASHIPKVKTRHKQQAQCFQRVHKRMPAKMRRFTRNLKEQRSESVVDTSRILTLTLAPVKHRFFFVAGTVCEKVLIPENLPLEQKDLSHISLATL